MPGIISVNPRSSISQKHRPVPSKLADNEQGTPLPAVALGVSKETRAYEHNRQRVKKTAETANLRVKRLAKETRHLPGSHWQPRPAKAARKGPGSRSSEDVADVDNTPVLDYSHIEEQPQELIGGERPDVSLADFVMSQKGRKGIDNDFEVIPHVRSVIILDDNQPHDIEIDEPWEYISGVDEDHKRSDPLRPSSYAMVVAQAK